MPEAEEVVGFEASVVGKTAVVAQEALLQEVVVLGEGIGSATHPSNSLMANNLWQGHR